MKQDTQNNSSTRRVMFAGLVLAAAGALAGCQTDESSVHDFFPADTGRSTQNFMTAQAASGARADATLRGFHFDGEVLNSLGEAKLDLLLKDDDSTEPLVIYMNLKDEDPYLRGRRDAVITYLEDRGVVKDQIEFKSGTNPNQTSLAAEHISRISRTESDGTDSSETSTIGASPSTGGGGTGAQK